MKLYVENNFPLAAKVQIEFLDELGNVITTLFNDQNRGDIAAAEILPGQEKTNGFVSSMVTAEVNEAKMSLVKKAVNIRIIATFDTPGALRYKIFDSYKLDVKVIGDFIYEQQL